MAVIESVGGNTVGVGNETGAPMHLVAKPTPVSVGSYSISLVSGTIAAALAASAQLWYLRNTDATRLFIIHRVRVQFQALTPFTAGTLTDFGFDLSKATSISAGGGGTDVFSASSPPRLRTSHAASIVASGSMRMATTGALTALTTIDPFALDGSLGDAQRVNPAAATEEVIVSDPSIDYRAAVGAGEHPLVLGQNEALVLRNRTVWPAAGTGIVRVLCHWSETTAY